MSTRFVNFNSAQYIYSKELLYINTCGYQNRPRGEKETPHSGSIVFDFKITMPQNHIDLRLTRQSNPIQKKHDNQGKK